MRLRTLPSRTRLRTDGLALVLVVSLFGTAARAAEPVDNDSAPIFIGFPDIARLPESIGATPGEVVRLSPLIPTRTPWNELIVSWNVASNVALTVEARAQLDGRFTRFYNLGHWALATNESPRTSVAGQMDADGAVQTDTLVLRAPATNVQVRLTFHGDTPAVEAFRFLGLSLINSKAPRRSTLPPATGGWTRVLDVPIRSQAEYPEGVAQWCSPTSLAMVLAYHAQRLRHPERAWDVRDVARAVFDLGWPGTGNWSFNVAFAGTQPGLRAYATRLASLRELEAWIAQDIPVIASVSYAMLKGHAEPTAGDGHLVVVVGFDAEGDVVTNDPGVRRERVRRTFRRADFERAWFHSRNTVYLVHPDSVGGNPGIQP